MGFVPEVAVSAHCVTEREHRRQGHTLKNALIIKDSI